MTSVYPTVTVGDAQAWCGGLAVQVVLSRAPGAALGWNRRVPRGERSSLALQPDWRLISGSGTGQLIGLSVWLLINIYEHTCFFGNLVWIFINQKYLTPSENIWNKQHEIFTVSARWGWAAREPVRIHRLPESFESAVDLLSNLPLSTASVIKVHFQVFGILLVHFLSYSLSLSLDITLFVQLWKTKHSRVPNFSDIRWISHWCSGHNGDI